MSSTWNGTSGNWATPTQWSNGVPGVGDEAIFNTGNFTVTFNTTDQLATIYGFDTGASFAITGGSLIKNGTSTLLIDNGGANGFSGVQINNGTVQLGNNDTNGSLGTGNVADNGTLAFDRTDSVPVTNLISGTGSLAQNGSGQPHANIQPYLAINWCIAMSGVFPTRS